MAMTVLVLDTPCQRHDALDFVRLEDAAAVALHDLGGVILSAIFPWGTDALFNRFQVPHLLEELGLAAARLDAEHRCDLARLTDFIRKHIREDEDYYLLFSAD